MFPRFLLIALLILVSTVAGSNTLATDYDSSPSTKPSTSRPNRPTKLKLCNDSSFPIIRIAFSYFDRGANQWHSQGWIYVRRNQCLDQIIPNFNGRPYSGDVLVRGESKDSWWGKPNAKICVNPRTDFDLLENQCRQGNNFQWENALVKITQASQTKVIHLTSE